MFTTTGKTMPREQMNDQQVASYLGMDLREVIKLASRGQIPCRRVAGKFLFHKGDLDHWIETQLHSLGKDRLADIAKGVSAHHGFDHKSLLVHPLIPAGGLAVPLPAKTRQAALRALVDLAERAQMVYAPDVLLDEIRMREEMCSTALAGGIALPHPRHPLEYDIAGSFVVVGLTPSGIPFGANDGSLTRLLFLICCKDERTHLHILARLGSMLHDQTVVDKLLEAEDADNLRRMLLAEEQALVNSD